MADVDRVIEQRAQRVTQEAIETLVRFKAECKQECAAEWSAERAELLARISELESTPVVPEGYRVQNDAGMWALYYGEHERIAAVHHTGTVLHYDDNESVAPAIIASARALDGLLYAARTGNLPRHAGEDSEQHKESP